MQFTPEFYLLFYASLKDVFKAEWADGQAPNSDLQIWELTREVHDRKTKEAKLQLVVKQRLGVNERYFYQRLKIAEKGKALENVKDSIAMTCFRYMGCQGRSVAAMFDHFCTKFEVPDDIAAAQLMRIEKSAKKLNSDNLQQPTKAQVGITKGIGGKCRHYLPNTQWWLYFYGYEVPENNTYQEGPWKLLSLVLTFTDEGNANLDVFIQNKTDPNHYNYKGSTDFDNSSDTVLTMHLHTDPGRARQLNIYVNVGTGAGELFMGQYLNYDEKGYIFSGTLIMERINKTEHPSPEPYAFTISRSAIEASDYPIEVKHVAPLLQDRKLNFRRTPVTINRATEIDIWQERRNKRRS